MHFHNEDNYDDHQVLRITGACDIARIKLHRFSTGNVGEAIAEESISIFWVDGYGSNNSYKELYSSDVLGLEDQSEGNKGEVYKELK